MRENGPLPGSEIFPALEKGTIDVADYVGPAVNYALGFSQVTDYIVMGPPGFMSLYQPVDIMDITVGQAAWDALSPQMKQFVEMEVHVYSDMHHAKIQKADQEAWKLFERFSGNLLGVITDLGFPIDGARDEKAGFKLIEAIRAALEAIACPHDARALPTDRKGARRLDGS